MSDPTQAAPDAVDTTNQIATGGASDPRPANDEGHADPLWGEVLAPVNLKLTRKTTDAEDALLLAEIAKATLTLEAADAEAKAAAKVKRDAQKALKAANTKATIAEVEEDRECPVRRRDGELVVLHPDTFEPMELDADQQQLLLPKPKTWADVDSEPADPPDYSEADEVAGVDRTQIRARLQEHESALAIARGVHAVPPQSEIDTWSPGVCSATINWLDSIDRGETEGDVLVVLPVWVTGARKEQQTAHQEAELPEDQITLVYEALRDGSLQPLSEGTMRLDRATVVASMKRHGVIKSTSQHLTQVLRMVADCGGLPQFSQAVADAKGAQLRLIYFIAKAKPCSDAVGEPDLRSEVLAEVERMLKPN